MVASLLEYETVDAEEVRAILEDRPYDRDAELVARPRSRTPTAVRTFRTMRSGLRNRRSLPPTISPEPA